MLILRSVRCYNRTYTIQLNTSRRISPFSSRTAASCRCGTAAVELAEGIRHAVRPRRAHGRQGVPSQLSAMQRVIVRHCQGRQVRHSQCLAAVVAGREGLDGATEPSFGFVVRAAVEGQAEQCPAVVPFQL